MRIKQRWGLVRDWLTSCLLLIWMLLLVIVKMSKNSLVWLLETSKLWPYYDWYRNILIRLLINSMWIWQRDCLACLWLMSFFLTRFSLMRWWLWKWLWKLLFISIKWKSASFFLLSLLSDWILHLLFLDLQDSIQIHQNPIIKQQTESFNISMSWKKEL